MSIKHLPNSWKVEKISDCMFFQEGPGVRKWQFRESGVKLLNVGNINNNEVDLSATKVFISKEEAFGKYSHFLVDEGDLLIACSGIVVDNFHNKIAFVKKEHLPLCLNTSTMRFRSLNQKIDINYFKYFLQTFIFKRQLQKNITGSAQLNFGPSHIKKINLAYPPLATQQKIAEILDAADAYRQQTKELIKKYDELAQSVFLDMFGDPVTNPKGWEKFQLQSITKIKAKGILPSNFKEGDHYIGLEDIESETGKILTKRLATEVGIKSNKYEFENGDILYGKLRPYLNKVASPNFSGVCSTDIIPISPKKDSKDFILSYLRGNWFVSYANSNTSGANLPRLSPKILKLHELIFPQINLQKNYSEKYQAISLQKQLAQQELEKADELFNSLMQKAFRGEIV